MGNKTPMMTHQHLLREKHGPYNQVVSKAPLREPSQHMMGEQD